MKSFREYLFERSAEVVATKRKDMIHFQKMKPLEFVEFARKIKTEMKGKLHNLKTSLKVDGLGGRFGRSPDGRPFFEGSRTGPIFEPKAFSAHAIAKGANQEIVLRAHQYDDMWAIITKSSLVTSLPNDTKVMCEIFYNPMGQVEGDGIRFVSIKYDRSKLGSLMTVVPYAVVVASTGEPHPEAEAILANLKKLSNKTITVVDAKLHMGTIDVRGIVDPIDTLTPEMLAAVKSLKHADRETKANTIAIIQAIKDEMAEYILNHPEIIGKFKLGPEIEGLVINVNNQDYKITTQKFKDSKAK